MRTCVASIPCDSKFLIVAGPKRSSPTRATIATSAPQRREATAWLAPLPPQPRSKSFPKMVSPAFGNRSENVVKSTFALPTTAILDRLDMSPLLDCDHTRPTSPTRPIYLPIHQLKKLFVELGQIEIPLHGRHAPPRRHLARAWWLAARARHFRLDEDRLAVAGAVIDIDVHVELLLLRDDAGVEEREH